MARDTHTKTAADPSMRIVGRPHANVRDLVREISDGKTFQEFERRRSEKRLVRSLTVMRSVQEVSQVELAARMGCTQSKISKIESSRDADLNFGDVVKYAAALDHGLALTLMPKRSRGVDRIRLHLSSVKQELDRLVAAAGVDPNIGDGVEAFALGTVHRLIRIIEESLAKLPRRREAEDPETDALAVEVAGDGVAPVEEAPRGKKRKPKRTTAADV